MGLVLSLEREITEAQAAADLGISKATLARDRAAGKVAPIIHGKRTIRYTESILREYQQQCRTVSDKSETTGLASAPVRNFGNERGSTSALDRRDAHRLALVTFRRPKSLSQSG